MSVSPCFDCYWKCPGSQSSNMRSLGSGQIAPYVQSGLIRGNRWLESTVVVDFEPGHGGTRCPAFQVRLVCELLFHLTYDQVSRVPVPTVTVECFWDIALGQNVLHLFIPQPPPSCCKCEPKTLLVRRHSGICRSRHFDEGSCRYPRTLYHCADSTVLQPPITLLVHAHYHHRFTLQPWSAPQTNVRLGRCFVNAASHECRPFWMTSQW